MALRRSSRALGLVALVSSALLAEPGRAGDAKAARAPVTLAEVASQVDASATRLRNLTDLLRQDVEAELRAIDWQRAKVRRRYRISAALVTLSSTTTGEHTLRASCVVSAAVRDDRGVLLAIVEGRARAEDAPSAAERAERDALSAAARSAIKAVPESIRRAQ
jgi:hypothetical protein